MVMVVRSGASALAEDSSVLLRLVCVDGLNSSGSVQFADDAVVNGIPHKVRDLGHPTAPESERGDCLRCTTWSRDHLMADDTESADSRSSSLHHTFATTDYSFRERLAIT